MTQSCEMSLFALQ